jgi:hypothetical protein
MAENILFTLVDEYGNSLENFKFGGRFSFYYNYPNKKPVEVLTGSMMTGIAYGTLPRPEEDLESTTLIIEFNSEFYNTSGNLLYKGQYPAPQKIAVSKKALDPEQRIDLLKRSTEDLKQAASERVGGGEITR